jgi:hypothetical protein
VHDELSDHQMEDAMVVLTNDLSIIFSHEADEAETRNKAKHVVEV